MSDEIRDKLLIFLYKAWDAGNHADSLNKLIAEYSWDKTQFWNVVDRCKHEGWIKPYASQAMYNITASGILKSEELELIPKDTIEKNQQTRTNILTCLAKDYEERGAYAEKRYESMIQELGIDQTTLYNNVELLRQAGYIESHTMGSTKITHYGLDAVKELREKESLYKELSIIRDLSPRERGIEFQKLFAKYLHECSWETSEGVRTSNEEIDIVMHKIREYYLLECIWLKKPVEAEVIREFHGKLSNRIDTNGIIVSMSGFTRGAVQQVKEYLSSKLIILFNQLDVESLFKFESGFDDLLNAKYGALVSKREVLLE